jgi:hypothetical protein
VPIRFSPEPVAPKCQACAVLADSR